MNKCSGEAQHRIVVSADERDERVLIARSQAREQLQVLIGRFVTAAGPADAGGVDGHVPGTGGAGDQAGTPQYPLTSGRRDPLSADGVRDRHAADLGELAGGADAEFIDDAVAAGLDIKHASVG